MEDHRSQGPEPADVERRLRGFELAQRISRVGHWRWTIASDELFWSDEVFRIHGHAPGDFRPDVRRAVAFYHPDDQAVVDGHLQRAIDERRDFEFQLRVVRPDGSIRDVLSSGFCELDGTGAVQALFGTFQDVTELRQAERDHAVVRRRLQLAVDSAGLGVWDLDLVGQRLSWDPRMLEMYGLDARQRTGAVDDWIGALHPEDRPRAVESFEAAIAGEADFDLRFRIVRRVDGVVRHMQANAVVERDADGRPLRMVGINQDVTERVQAEARFRAALDHLAVATFICRPDGIVEFANEAAAALFGADPGRLEGRDLGGLLGPDALGTGVDPRPGQLAFDRRARRLDGSSFPAHVGTGELDGPDGRRLVVSVQDLSTLRDLQQQLGHAQRM
ncbi:MAG: PAS domain-containing protein, partial [Pseudomonadales bacterium]|nr:PAS domain-containing protein [Pseudomonadales bacterium]